MFFRTTAAPNDRRGTNPAGTLVPSQQAQCAGSQVQEAGNTGCQQVFGCDKDTVFGHHHKALQQTMQRDGGFAGTAVAHQQHSTATTTDGGGVQRHQPLRARSQHIDGEFDEFVTGVVGVAQHVARNDDQRRRLRRHDDRQVRLVHRPTHKSGTRPGLQRRWLCCRFARLAGRELQPDAQARRAGAEPVPWQTGKGLFDQTQQLHAVALKSEQRAEQVQAAAMPRRQALAKRIGDGIDRRSHRAATTSVHHGCRRYRFRRVGAITLRLHRSEGGADVDPIAMLIERARAFEYGEQCARIQSRHPRPQQCDRAGDMSGRK